MRKAKTKEKESAEVAMYDVRDADGNTVHRDPWLPRTLGLAAGEGKLINGVLVLPVLSLKPGTYTITVERGSCTDETEDD